VKKESYREAVNACKIEICLVAQSYVSGLPSLVPDHFDQG